MPKSSKEKEHLKSSDIVESETLESKKRDLVQRVSQLKASYSRQIEYRKEFEKKLEYLSTFWKIKKKELEDTRKRRKHLELTRSLIDDEHQAELNLCKEKIKLLLYQQFNELSLRKLDSHSRLKEIVDRNDTYLSDLYREKQVQKNFLNQEQWSHQEHALQLKIDRDRRLTAIREEFKLKSCEIINHTEQQLKEIREINIHGNVKHLTVDSSYPAKVIEKHDQEMLQIRQILNDKAHDNVDRLEMLEKKLILFKKMKVRSEKILKQLRLENESIKGPLQQAQYNIILLEEKFNQSHTQKIELARNQDLLKSLTNSLKDVMWKYEVLLQKHQALEKENNQKIRKIEGLLLIERQSKE